jgi:predicted AAA+ superfamily ATPase
MEPLFNFHNRIINNTSDNWFRYLFSKLDWSPRLLGLKGLRGVGKTTMLVQYAKYVLAPEKKSLYVTIDHPWFYKNDLFDLAEAFSMQGGDVLLIDEIHKYPNWSRELKVIHDGFPELQVIFTSSSALEIFRGEADLSRRTIVRELHGMSFREYLHFFHGVIFEPIRLDDLISNHETITSEILRKVKPIAHFSDYLKRGYFPFAINEENTFLDERLHQIINTVLESDLTYIQDYSAQSVINMKKLLGAIASSVPFEPNISKLASKLQMGRDTINQYLKAMHDARLLALANKPGKGVGVLQKPDKIYFENTNLAQSMNIKAETGAIRETFFLNQLRNAGHTVHLASKGDFLVDEQRIFEIGGSNKTTTQVKGLRNAFLAKDNIEYGHGNTIPLWLFGFLY